MQGLKLEILCKSESTLDVSVSKLVTEMSYLSVIELIRGFIICQWISNYMSLKKVMN